MERGNRRYRKMQKQVYRVRTQGQISARLALDMWREAHAEGRQQTLAPFIVHGLDKPGGFTTVSQLSDHSLTIRVIFLVDFILFCPIFAM